jgi:hypothetical protein
VFFSLTATPLIVLYSADIEVFLAGYPSQASDAHRSANLEFYTNEREMQPDGLTLDQFVRRYERDYEELESNQ